MHLFALATAAASVVSAVSAANILVKVGASGLTFDPSNVAAAVGDTIAFQFYPKNHSVTQSTFGAPCTLMDTPAGIDSGYQPVSADATQVPEWSLTVNNATGPLWFFCAQKNHCAGGMVFSVNAPATGKTFAAFQAAAIATGATNATGNTTASGATAQPGGALMTRASGAGAVAVLAGVVGALLL